MGRAVGRPGGTSDGLDELDRGLRRASWDLSSAAPSFWKGPWRARGRQSGPLVAFRGGLGRSSFRVKAFSAPGPLPGGLGGPPDPPSGGLGSVFQGPSETDFSKI